MPFLVGLLAFGEGAVFVQREVLTFDVGDEVELHGTVVELLIREHPVLHEDLQAFPFLLEEVTFVAEEFIQTVCHFLRDVVGDLLDLCIALEIGA